MIVKTLSMKRVKEILIESKDISRNDFGFMFNVLGSNEPDADLSKLYSHASNMLWDLDLTIMNRKNKQLVKKNIKEERSRMSILLSKEDYEIFKKNQKGMKLSVCQYLSFLIRLHNELLMSRFIKEDEMQEY